MFSTSRNSGFTLIEILVALLLVGVLSAALYGSYFSVAKARERAAAGMESRRELGATLDLLRREISSALIDQTDKRFRLLVEDRDNFGEHSSTLELTALAPPGGVVRPESGIINIRYQLLERNGRRVLTRQEKDLFFEDKNEPSYLQMEQVSAFLVECHDGAKWVKSWDTRINRVLPRSIRITVRVMEEGMLRDFSTVAILKVKGA